MGKHVRLIQSIQRAMDIINCFDEKNYKLSIGEISDRLSLHVNTTRGIVNTLVYNGYLSHDREDNKYSLGLAFIPKADLVHYSFLDRIKDYTKPYLKLLADKYQVSARLQLVANDNIFTVETINPVDSRYILLTRLDTSFPLNCTSSGKLFLYYLAEETREEYLANIPQVEHTSRTIIDKETLKEELQFIEKNGYSREFEESGTGISSVAVPILGKSDGLKGSISITASTPIIKEVLESSVQAMQEYSKNIKEQLSL